MWWGLRSPFPLCASSIVQLHVIEERHLCTGPLIPLALTLCILYLSLTWHSAMEQLWIVWATVSSFIISIEGLHLNNSGRRLTLVPLLGTKGPLKGKGHRHPVAQKRQWTPSKFNSEEVGIYENDIRHYLSRTVNILFAWMGIQTDCGNAWEILMPSWPCDWKQATRLIPWGSLAVREEPSSFPFQPLL